ncbi:mtDNA inheritance, partitioning of the mitochondrial organelle [Cladophialophora chaetospira]|uniref:Protein DML1 n=1 Tax=Cladophialophora chaetospira TaxID=386627 RepID=A0AA38XAJ3_9EURO|nr:mtDNA inheritance, partitioning of the mitochondrial organelle [Cladophialophora chaetospira]
MHEIVTLQLGQRSNYLATHFWNAQESYFTYSDHEQPVVDHDIHFRPGLGADGSETYTPRTIIYDLKGGFGTLRKFNALYDIQHEPSAQEIWAGTPARQAAPPIEPSEYQRNLELGLPTTQLQARDVRYWSDFNRVFYHPRSIVQLNEYELNSQLMPFEDWSAGEELFQSLDKEFDLLDRDVRPFVEECDQMQGFQLFSGADDAWGGFASKYLDHLRDEYGKNSVWVWGIEDQSRTTRQKQLLRTSNAARTLRSLGQQASAYIRLASPPASLPSYVKLDSTSEWLQLALLCTGVESITLPTRFSAGVGKRGSLSLLEDTLNTTDTQNLFELHASVTSAATIANGSLNNSSRDQNGRAGGNQGADMPGASRFDLDYSPGLSTPSTARSTHVFAQVQCLRDHLESSTHPLTLSPDERLRRRHNDESVVEIFQTALQFPLLDTFPDTLFETGRTGQQGLDISTALVCDSSMKNRVLDLRNTTARLASLDERESLYNDLTQIAQNYGIGWESGTDSGVDDD